MELRTSARSRPPLRGRASLLALAGLELVALLAASLPGTAEDDGERDFVPFVWVDESGHTFLTNDPEQAPEPVQQRAAEPWEHVRELWTDGLTGPPLAAASTQEEERVLRLLSGALADLRRGESARAAAALRSVLRLAPGRPEAHWYLAWLDRQRGRYASAEAHLQSFLAHAGANLEPWRARAEHVLVALGDEQRLADEAALSGEARFVHRNASHFELQVDAELGELRAGYGDEVLGFLEEARVGVEAALGVVPREPLGVVLYGRARYQQVHAHRFSFRTVGFFDGRIHVSSPAHPGAELRALLFHEYTHAVFREQTGGDRPYWLNEGLAEHMERRSRGQPLSTRSERASLRGRIHGGRWLPLRRLGPSFGGLADDDARAAYLQSIVAVEWLDRNSTAAQRARILQRLGQGHPADQAFHDALGMDVDEIDAAVRLSLVEEFPPL